MIRLESAAAGLVSLVAACLFAWLGMTVIAAPARADELLAVALVCPAGVEPADCSRDNAVDVVSEPVALPTICLKVGEVLATHLALGPGQRHRVLCERRKG